MATTWSGFNDVTVKSNSSFVLVNSETGEMVSDIGFVATHNVTKDSGFEKIWITEFLTTIGVVTNKKIDVVSYVILEAKKRDNLYLGTYDDICKATGISYGTVAKTMKQMIDHGLFLQKVPGCYIVNPDILFRGSYSRRMAIVNMWQEAKDKKEREVPTKERQIADLRESISRYEKMMAKAQKQLYSLENEPEDKKSTSEMAN